MTATEVVPLNTLSLDFDSHHYEAKRVFRFDPPLHRFAELPCKGVPDLGAKHPSMPLFAMHRLKLFEKRRCGFLWLRKKTVIVGMEVTYW